MADQRLPELNPVVTPALTDIIGTRQSGDTRDKRETLAQVLSLYVEVNDLTAAVVWANIPDANVPETAVTQHAAAVAAAIDVADLNDVAQVTPTQYHALARNAGNTGWESRLLVEADISDMPVTISQAEAEAGVATTDRLFTAERVGQAIAALGGAGDVTKVGTPVNDQIGVWTGDGTIEGDANFTWSGSVLQVAGTIQVANASGGVLVNEAASGTNPTLIPDKNSLTTGIGAVAPTAVSIIISGVEKLRVDGAGDVGVEGDLLNTAGSFRPGFLNAASSATVPNLVPNHVDRDTGIGSAAADQLSLIAGGVEGFRVTEATAVITNQSFGQLIVPTGTLALPSIVFAGDLTTGIFSNGAGSGILDIAAGGTIAVKVDNTLLQMATAGAAGLRNVAAAAATPSVLPNKSDQDTGIGYVGSDSFSFVTGGLEAMRLTEAGAVVTITAKGAIVAEQQYRGPSGGTSAPTYSFTADPDSGMYHSASAISFTWNNANQIRINAAGIFGAASGAPQLANVTSSVTVPGLRPNVLDDDTGMGYVSNDVGNLVAGGVSVASFYELGGHPKFIIDQGDAGTGLPTLVFGSTAAEGFKGGAGSLYVMTGNNAQFRFVGASLRTNLTGGGAIENVVASATVPSVRSNNNDVDTGLGAPTLDQISLIAGGVEGIRVTEAAAVITVDVAGELDVTGEIHTNNAAGGAILNEVASDTNPTIIAHRADPLTGLGATNAGELHLIANSIRGLTVKELNGGVLQVPAANLSITAYATGGQTNAVTMWNSYNVISVCATAGDSVKLPSAFSANSVLHVKNDGAQSCDVFPANGDDLGAGTDTAVALAAGASLSFIGTVASTTWTQLIV